MSERLRLRRLTLFGLLAGGLLAWGILAESPSMAQEAPPAAEPASAAPPTEPETAGDEASRRLNEALGAEAPAPAAPTTEAPPAMPEIPQIDYLDLLIKGGLLGIPIGIISLVVVAVSIERTLALRRSRVIPEVLLRELGEMSAQGSLDPRKAYRVCQQHPSTAATIIRAMLLKVGRPHSEVEHAVVEASEREASRLYRPVRTLTFAVAVCPLLGLLGTVWGMIEAFFATAYLPTGVNKAQALADGIYKALVTTAEGLSVAIPAAILAHLFEGRIQTLMREIDELLYGLLPQVERYEGKLRVRREQVGGEKSSDNGAGKTQATSLDDEPESVPPRLTTAK